jgi:hypothetical protein
MGCRNRQHADREQSTAQEENGNSRVYAGLHFRTAIDAGERLGRPIGRFASSTSCGRAVAPATGEAHT